MTTLQEAVKTLESWRDEDEFAGLSGAIRVVLAHHIVEWPKELTREGLEKLAEEWNPDTQLHRSKALRALAAIAPPAPPPRKRVVEIWEHAKTKEYRLREIGTQADWMDGSWGFRRTIVLR